jgi:hypothetical protein
MSDPADDDQDAIAVPARPSPPAATPAGYGRP